jgi:hypothetical protein
VPRKFHQAALLCLSLGLCFSSPVILNSVYLKWVTIEKLKLDTFFLGFSFPLSLISMSVIFSLMKKEALRLTCLLKEAAFWIINLGVIIFFVFILANMFASQVTIALILFGTVALIFYLYWHEACRCSRRPFFPRASFFYWRPQSPVLPISCFPSPVPTPRPIVCLYCACTPLPHFMAGTSAVGGDQPP